MTKRATWFLVLAAATAAEPGAAQGIVVDQGQFEISVDGRTVGREEFVIRRAGLGRDNSVFANGVVTMDVEGGRQEIHPLLSATPPAGTASGYQVRVTGPQAMELRLSLAGRRYLARISSEVGDEDREFSARPTTRILEQDVAHHYYFLRDLREGRSAHVLEPRLRRQFELVAGPRTEDRITVAGNPVQARRAEFGSDDDRRIVWYDQQGRVLRVEIPSAGYVARRTDVVG